MNGFEESFEVVSISQKHLSITFMEVFDESIHSPKNCDLCVGFRTNNVSEEVYRKYTKLKDLAKAHKSYDKENEKYVFIVNLQN